MSKYIDLQRDVFSIFGSLEWQGVGIATYPREFSNIDIESSDNKAIRVSILPSGKAVNALSASGVIMIEIITLLSEGPTPIIEIADSLDDFLVRKTINTYTETCTQFFESTLGISQQDSVNPRIGTTLYSIPFQHTGVE
jgi:hypothetical protein